MKYILTVIILFVGNYILEMAIYRADLKKGIKNGSKEARTPDLSRVRRTLIPAELCFHAF